MEPVVVDTNVPAVANARDGAPPACVRACARRLREIEREGCVVLDDNWRILKEYDANLRHEGQPGVGDAFYKWVLTNRANPKRCRLVPIHPIGGSDTDFEEFPTDPRLAEFDPADRKFVAVSAAASDHPPILQALDSDWWSHRDALRDCGVRVEFLCEDDIRRIHRRKTGAA